MLLIRRQVCYTLEMKIYENISLFSTVIVQLKVYGSKRKRRMCDHLFILKWAENKRTLLG